MHIQEICIFPEIAAFLPYFPYLQEMPENECGQTRLLEGASIEQDDPLWQLPTKKTIGIHPTSSMHCNVCENTLQFSHLCIFTHFRMGSGFPQTFRQLVSFERLKTFDFWLNLLRGEKTSSCWSLIIGFVPWLIGNVVDWECCWLFDYWFQMVLSQSQKKQLSSW